MNHMNTREDQHIDFSAMESVVHWIHSHYDQKIDEQELAKQMFVSQSVFSRRFYAFTGRKFTDYVNYVKLEHAAFDLIHSSKSITDVALDNGFSNISVFCRLFRSHTGLSPKKYRTERAGQARLLSEPEKKELHFDFSETAPCDHIIRPLAAVNVQDVEQLLQNRGRQQIRMLKHHLGITHIRFWNFFSDKMFDAVHTLRFERMDTVVDFLTENGLHPWIVIGKSEKQVHRDFRDREQVISEKQIFSLFEAHLLPKLMDHWIKRYGLSEVKCWRFELSTHDILGNGGSFDDYIETWMKLRQRLRQSVPDAALGALCKPSAEFDLMEQFLKRWIKYPIHPDFLSVYSFPYRYEAGDRMALPCDFSHDAAKHMRKILQDFGMTQTTLAFTEWNITVSTRNALNDSCVRAAFLLHDYEKSLTDPIPLIASLAADTARDLMDARMLTCGGLGLLTCDALPKPAFHALNLLHQMPDGLLSHEDGCIVSTDKEGRFDLLLYHPCPLPEHYYQLREYEITEDFILNQIPLTCRPRSISLSLRLPGPGPYHLRTFKILSGKNDLLDGLTQFGSWEHLQEADLDYLRTKIQPEQSIELLPARNNLFEREIVLAPYDIWLLSFTPV